MTGSVIVFATFAAVIVVPAVFNVFTASNSAFVPEIVPEETVTCPAVKASIALISAAAATVSAIVIVRL